VENPENNMTEDPLPDPLPNPVVDVTFQDPVWLEHLPNLEALAQEVISEVLINPGNWRHCSTPAPALPVEASICFAGDDFVADLNSRYRSKKGPTNVLSFPAGEGALAVGGREVLLGDIVLAFGVTSKEAEEQGKPLQDHTIHLLVHGVLHLLGFRHNKPLEAKEMETLEISTLEGFGIADPYASRVKQGMRA